MLEKDSHLSDKTHLQTYKVVIETNWHHTQKATAHKDGGVTLSFQVDGLEEIANWVLTWTGCCKVLNPPELRQLIIGKLEKALAMNRG